MAESEGELKSLLMKVKKESEKVGLKLNIQKIKIMASGPITSWQIDGETVEAVSDFIFLGSRITADGDFSHEIKRHLLLGRKLMTNLDSILKSRDITLSGKVRLVNAMVFPVVMYGCESWTIKKAEHRRIDAFILVSICLMNCNAPMLGAYVFTIVISSSWIVIHTVKGFGMVKKAEIDVFLELSCFFDDPLHVGNLISCSSAFSKTSLNIWKFSVHILLKPGYKNFEHYFTSV